MKPTGNIQQSQMGSGHRLPQWLLVLALVMATLQAAPPAFSQEEVPPSPSTPQSPAPDDDKRLQVLQIPQGAFVEVRLISGEILQGRLGEVLDEGFMLRTLNYNRLENVHVRFVEFRSIRAVNDPMMRDVMTRNRAFDRHFRRNRRYVRIAARGHRGAMFGGAMMGGHSVDPFFPLSSRLSPPPDKTKGQLPIALLTKL